MKAIFFLLGGTLHLTKLLLVPICFEIVLISKRGVYAAALAANADGFIRKMEDGYNTIAG